MKYYDFMSELKNRKIPFTTAPATALLSDPDMIISGYGLYIYTDGLVEIVKDRIKTKHSYESALQFFEQLQSQLQSDLIEIEGAPEGENQPIQQTTHTNQTS